MWAARDFNGRPGWSSRRGMVGWSTGQPCFEGGLSPLVIETPRGLANLPLRAARVEEVNRRRVVELWNTPGVLLLLVLILSVEWALRRRWGRL